MIFKVILIFLFLPMWVEAGGAEGTPLQFVFFQILNFSLFALVLGYLVRKKLPIFLQRKKEDFLEYQKKAKEMEKQSQLDYLSLKKELDILVEKEKNLKKSIEKALNNLKEELTEQGKQWRENLKVQATQEFKRQRLKGWVHLKDRILSQVMQQTQAQLKEIKKQDLIENLNYQMIQKWEQI